MGQIQYKLQHLALDDPESSINRKLTTRPSNSGKLEFVSYYTINAQKKKKVWPLNSKKICHALATIDRQMSAKVMMTIEFHTNMPSSLKITKK
jgi:hypothetical protein